MRAPSFSLTTGFHLQLPCIYWMVLLGSAHSKQTPLLPGHATLAYDTASWELEGFSAHVLPQLGTLGPHTLCMVHTVCFSACLLPRLRKKPLTWTCPDSTSHEPLEESYLDPLKCVFKDSNEIVYMWIHGNKSILGKEHDGPSKLKNSPLQTHTHQHRFAPKAQGIITNANLCEF